MSKKISKFRRFFLAIFLALALLINSSKPAAAIEEIGLVFAGIAGALVLLGFCLKIYQCCNYNHDYGYRQSTGSGRGENLPLFPQHQKRLPLGGNNIREQHV